MTERSRRDFLRAATAGTFTVLVGCSSLEKTPQEYDMPAEQIHPQRNETATVRTTSTVTSQINRVSDYRDLEEAVGSVQPDSALFIDETCVLTAPVELKSDMFLIGNGGKVVADSGANIDLLRTRNVSNVVISGVEVDGNKSNGAAGRLIGGYEPGTVENLRITNCHIHDSGLDNIALAGSWDSTDVLTDIYIANNRIENAEKHGCVLGVYDSGSKIENVLIENNTVKGTVDNQDIGVFCVPDAVGRNVAFLGNECTLTSTADAGGTQLALETEVRNSVMYGNTVDGANSGKTGCAATKDAENNIVANNLVRNSNDAVHFGVFDHYLDFDRDYKYDNNLMIRNHIKDSHAGVRLKNINGRVAIIDNRMENVKEVTNNRGGNSGTITVQNNNANVSPAGVPEFIGSSALWTDSDGYTVGAAYWDRGSASPDSPVTVSVQTNVRA